MGSLPRPTIEYNPQQNDPLSAIEKVTSLRSMLQNQQLKQQEVQAAQLENQQRQMAVRDQQVVRDAFVKNGGDPDKTLQDAARAGVSPATLQQLQLHAADLKTKNLALINAQGEKALRDADLMKGAYDTLVKTPPEQRPQVYPQLVNGLKQAQVDVSQLSPQYPGDDHLPILGALIQGHSKGIEEAAKQAGISKDQATAAKDQADATKTQLEASAIQQFGGLTPQMAESKYLFLQTRKNQGLPVGGADAAYMKAYEKQKTLNATTTFNLQGGNQQFGATDPSVQAVAEGRMKIGDVLTPRTPLPVRKQFLSAVQQANPNFDSRNYDVEKGVMKEFTSGDAAKNLTAFNTAIEHANQLSTAADALENRDARGLNKIGNALGYQFGSDKVTNFNVIKNALSGEISKVFKGGQATDAEIREVQGPFDTANSPAQLKGAIKNAIALMNSKRDALKQQYQSGVQAKPNFSGTTPPTGGADPFAAFGGTKR